MPMGKLPLELASSSCGSSLLPSELLPWWRIQEGGGLGGSPLNKLAGILLISLVCRSSLGLSSSAAATVVVVNVMGKSMEMVPAAGSRAHHRWRLRRSYGARGWQPVSIATLSILQVERQPTLFLPALMLYGRQCCSSSVSTASGSGDLVGPSGFVPGAGEIRAVREQLGPDCVPFLLLGVLSAYFRDYFVISSLLGVLMFVLAPYRY